MFQLGTHEFNIIAVDSKNRKIERKGYLCSTAEAISKNLNFKYQSNAKGLENRPVFPNVKNHFEWAVVNLNAATHKRKFVFSYALKYDEVYLAIPPGEEFNCFKKLLLPFDAATMFWISVTFSTAFITVAVLKFSKLKVRILVYGRNVEGPAMNVIRAFFGLSQTVVPQNFFARFLLMVLVLFSLVIRTAYQGKMFEFMQKEMRKPTVKSVDEMIDKKFTFFTQLDFKRVYNSTDFVQRYESNP